MNLNEQKLEKWYRTISHFEKLKFPETKKLLAEIKTEQNPERKKEIREQIILGTLHVIYSFIKSNDVYLLPNANYDIDDVIQVYIEAWINIIDSKNFEKIYSYSQIFHHLYKKTNELLVEKNDNFLINFESFDLILNYVMNNNIGYSEFYNFVKLCPNISLSDVQIQELYIMINDIVKYVFDVLGDDIFSLTNRQNLRNLLISFKGNVPGIPMLDSRDFEEQVVDKIYYEQVFASLDAIPKPLISKKDFELMKRILHYKIDNGMSFKEIGEIFNLTSGRIGQIHKKASASLKRAARVID